MEHGLIVGPGRAGLSVAYALARSGEVQSVTVCGRQAEPLAHPLFTEGHGEYAFGLVPPSPLTEAAFLAVPDEAIPELAHALGGQRAAPEGCAAPHLSGALSTEVLGPLHTREHEVGSFHPLQALADPGTGAERLAGSCVPVTGRPGAASAVAIGFLPPLMDAACRLPERVGIPRDQALAVLLPLVCGRLENIAERGVEGTATGPVPRGDVESIGPHLRALEPEGRRLYATLGLELLRLAAPCLPEDARRSLVERLNAEITR